MKAQLIRYLAYNVWANGEYIKWLNTLPQEALTEAVPSSFPSITETMLHIWDAQHVWHTRLAGGIPNGFPSKTFAGTWEDVCTNVQETSNALLTLVNKQPASWLKSEMSYKLINGDPAATLVADMILHCTQHSTFHRGQIVTMAHVLHMKQSIPATDYIFYIRKVLK